MASSLRNRLLQDIAELQSKPYPNISLHVQDDNITQACLILTVVDGYGPMHLTVDFPHDYPLSPPRIRMDSDVSHPNIFGTYICASILNTTEGYTPAYTLKGIAIQLLSFFSSDKIEQDGGGYSVSLYKYRDTQKYVRDTHVCRKCSFGATASNPGISFSANREAMRSSGNPAVMVNKQNWPTLQESAVPKKRFTSGEKNPKKPQANSETSGEHAPFGVLKTQDAELPDEIVLMICGYLETEDLMSFAETWDRVGGIMTKFDVIRTRELQCFCLKKDFKVSGIKLGVGVSVKQKGRLGFLESEFDLLSQEAYEVHAVQRSVQGVPFQYWLPLPISYGHWRKVQGDVSTSLSALTVAASLGTNVPPVQVIYNFMNDVVVKLNHQPAFTPRAESDSAKSTLRHASEKAMESYFHLFHLLLCMATSQPRIIKAASTTLEKFISGATSKVDCPNLGHLLIAALISDVEMTPAVMKSIIKEAITRNVVWMLNAMPELAYMEPSAISHYRLKHTFEASKTSYRLLMFLNLFRRAAVGSPRKPLKIILDEAFERHGAPPRGSAKKLADSIKYIHTVDNFPDFLFCMGIEKPSGEWFTEFLRKCIKASEEKRYSKMPFSQNHALWLRQEKEPSVEVQPNFPAVPVDMSGRSFFPGKC